MDECIDRWQSNSKNGALNTALCCLHTDKGTISKRLLESTTETEVWEEVGTSFFFFNKQPYTDNP